MICCGGVILVILFVVMVKGRISFKIVWKIDGSMLDSKKVGNGKLWKFKDFYLLVGVVDLFVGRYYVMKIYYCWVVGNLYFLENLLFCEVWGWWIKVEDIFNEYCFWYGIIRLVVVLLLSKIFILCSNGEGWCCFVCISVGY